MATFLDTAFLEETKAPLDSANAAAEPRLATVKRELRNVVVGTLKKLVNQFNLILATTTGQSGAGSAADQTAPVGRQAECEINRAECVSDDFPL